MRVPDGLLSEVIEARYFARAFWTYKSARKKSDLPKGDPMMDLVRQIDFDLKRQEIADRA
jgi:hypothetical protein